MSIGVARSWKAFNRKSTSDDDRHFQYLTMKTRTCLLFSLFVLLSLGLYDGTEAVGDLDEYSDGKWESNPDSPMIRVPLGESPHQLSAVLGFDPRRRVASLRERHRTANQRWPLFPSYQARYDLSPPRDELGLDEQEAVHNLLASRLENVLVPASKRLGLQHVLETRSNRGVGMMRMG